MKSRQEGMTLLEVLLALVIFAVASLALMNSFNGMLNGQENLRQRTLALWVADNALTESCLYGKRLPAQGVTALAADEWPWGSDIIKDEDGMFSMQRIRVSTGNGQMVELHGLASFVQDKGHAATP